MELEDKILKRLNSLYWARKSNEIVKYPPEWYNEQGVYCRDEWTCFSDIGKAFNGKLFTAEEYLEVENRYIACVEDIATSSQCKYLTIGYLEDYNNSGYRYKERIAKKHIHKVLRDMLRDNVFCVLVNLKRNVMIDIGFDYYMHVLCPLEYDVLNRIVEFHKLYLNPRSKV